MPTNTNTDLCEKMFRIRTFLGLKQADIAFQMNDISPAAYGKLERGEVQNPTVSRLQQFAFIAGVPLSDFLEKGADDLIQQIIEARASPNK